MGTCSTHSKCCHRVSKHAALERCSELAHDGKAGSYERSSLFIGVLLAAASVCVLGEV